MLKYEGKQPEPRSNQPGGAQVSTFSANRAATVVKLSQDVGTQTVSNNAQ